MIVPVDLDNNPLMLIAGGAKGRGCNKHVISHTLSPSAANLMMNSLRGHGPGDGLPLSQS
jgi:hypothetical protein